MFKVFTGRYRALERELVEDVSRLKRQEPLAPVLIISPSGHMITRLQELLSERLESAVNVYGMGFYALAEFLLANQPASDDQWVSDPTLYSEVIRDLIDGNESAELVLRRFFRPENGLLPKGLPSVLSGTLRDLRDSGARVVDCLRTALEGHLGEAAPEAAPTLELCARMYEVLQKHGLRTSADLLRRASQRVTEHPFIRMQKAVYLYGFYDLTGVQLDFVLSFAQHAAAKIFFLHEPDQLGYAFTERLLNDPALTSKSEKRVHLSSPQRTCATEISNCSGAYDEVWLSAKKILKLAETGVPFHQIAVSARTLDSYIGCIREIFASHHIPYSTSQEERVSSYPLIKWSRQLFTLERENYPVNTVLDVLKSPYFLWSHMETQAVTSWQMESVTRQAGISSGWRSWDERLQRWSSGREDADAKAAESLQAAVRSLHKILRDEGTLQSWSTHVGRTKQKLELLFIKPADWTEEEDRLWAALQKSLDDLSTLDALGRLISYARFLEVWDDKLNHLTLALAPSGKQGVQVIDIMSARGLSFKAVFLLGMNEKIFPRLIREDPFLSDAARSALAASLGCRLSRQLDGYQEERLLFELALDLPEEHLYLSYQRSDEEGRALIPSLYLHEFDKSSLKRHHLARTPAEKWLQSDLNHLTPKEMSILLNREGAMTADFYRLGNFDSALYKELAEGQNALESFKVFGNRDGLVGPQPALQRLLTAVISPNSLKELAECPFRYFVGKVLNLEPSDATAAGELTADVLGKLVHRILEVFFKKLRNLSGTYLDTKDLQEQLDHCCTEVFRSSHVTALDLYPLAWIASKRVIRDRLRTFVKADLEELGESGFKPTYLEVDVAGRIAALSAPLDALIFKGRVDRVDLREANGSVQFRVVDYKTGRATRLGTNTETSVIRGQYLQLPIYLGLVEGWLKDELGRDVEGSEAAFYNLADWDKGAVSPTLRGDFWFHHGKIFSENLAGLVDLVKKGIFYIRPSPEHGYCSWCQFAQLCRKEHKPSAMRSETHPPRVANDERLLRKADRDRP